MGKFLISVISFLVLGEIKAASENDRFLSLPQKKLCDNRFMEAKFEGKNFFFSGHDPELKDVRYDWLDARNECRKRCMETISFKDQKKFDFFKSYIQKNNISFIWTSGRLCDFAGCEGRWDLLPKRIKGWLWSADQTRIDDTNKIPTDWEYTPWSRTGHFKKAQPDNAEFYIAQVGESCLGILNNQYNDSVAWHDIACYHKTRFICEDSEQLLIDVENQDEEEATDTPSTVSTSTSTTQKPPFTKRVTSQSTEEAKKRRVTSTSTTATNDIQFETTELLESSSIKAIDLSETSKISKKLETTTKKSPFIKRVTSQSADEVKKRRVTSTTSTTEANEIQFETTELLESSSIDFSEGLKISKKLETTTKKSPFIKRVTSLAEAKRRRLVPKSTTEATEKQIEPTEILESSSIKAITETSTTSKPRETTRGPPIPRRRFRAKSSSTTSTTQPATTENSKQLLDPPANDIQVEETTTNVEIETTALPSTTSTTDSPIPRKFPRRTRIKPRNF